MADIRFTEGPDNYIQPASSKNDWNNYFGLGGDDTIKIISGTAIGGPGNDRMEKLPIAGEPWWLVGVAYWDSLTGVRVDLQGGWADDGYGSRDTLIGIDVVHGNWHDDWFQGNSGDNFFWGNGGNDTVLGGGGTDTVGIPGLNPADGSPGRSIRLDELDIQVSVDGRTATIQPKVAAGTGFRYTLTDVEQFQVDMGGNSWANLTLSDFITQQSMAEQAIAAGGGWRWNAAQPLGSATNVTFSFVAVAPGSGVGATGFRVFSATEQQLVRDILTQTSAITGISFTEVADNGASAGQMRFGISQQAATKGVSWLPGQAGAGDLAGDVWMDVESMTGVAPGTEGYAALLHEIGHALGLRHPRNVDPGDSWVTQLRALDDRTALSVMASQPSADGLFRTDWGPLDVLALRYLYGGKASSLGDTRYMIGNAQAAAQTTLLDDGGVDTIDASSQSIGVQIRLQPGGLSSVGLSPAGVAGVENLGIAASSWIENAIGSAFDDVLIGNDLDNRLTGNLGNDWIEGGKGIDTAWFAGKLTDYWLTESFGKNLIEACDGVSGFDTLTGIERLQFQDAHLGFDVDGNAGQVYRLYKAAFARTPDLGGLGGWIAGMDSGLTLEQVANSFIASAEFQSLYGASSSNGQFVTALYLNVMGRAPDAGGYGYWVNQLASSLQTRAQVLVAFSESAENKSATAGLTANGILYASAEQAAGPARGQLWSGTSAADTLIGSVGADTLDGAAGNDHINGGAGIDISLYGGSKASHTITRSANGLTVSGGTDGTDTLVNVERLKFADIALAFDLDGNAGQTYRLYQAAFDRTPDTPGLSDWIRGMDGGMSLKTVASGFIGSAEFQGLYGANPTNTQFIDLLYANVLNRAPDQAGYDYWLGQMAGGMTRELVLIGFSESTENQAALLPVIQGGILYVG